MTKNTKQLIKELENHVARDVIKLATNITKKIIERNPVDIRFSASSWFWSIGAPLLIDTDRTLDNVAKQEALQDSTIVSLKAGYTFKDGKLYITNNVNYIGLLENGSSKQAPNGFVKKSVSDGVHQTRQ